MKRVKKRREQAEAPASSPGRGIMILWGAMFLLVVLALFNIVPISQGISPMRSRKERKLILSAENMKSDGDWDAAAEIYRGLLEDSRAAGATRVRAALNLHEIYRDHLFSPGLALDAIRSAYLLERDEKRQEDLRGKWSSYAAGVGTVDRPYGEPFGTTVIAEVGGDRVTFEEILLAWKRSNPDSELTEENFGKFVMDYMTNALLAEGGRRRGSAREKTYLLDMRNLERSTLSREIQVTLHKPSSRESVEAFYKEHPEKFMAPDSVALDHIVVRSESEATSVGLRLASGEDFFSLAMEASLDRETLPRGAELGAMGITEDFIPGVGIIPGFARRISKKDDGYTTGPFPTARGFHWFRLDSKRIHQASPLDQVYQKAEREQRKAGFEAARRALLDQLKKEIPVTIHEDRIKSALEEIKNRQAQKAGVTPTADELLRSGMPE